MEPRAGGGADELLKAVAGGRPGVDGAVEPADNGGVGRERLIVLVLPDPEAVDG